ncbi:MAG: 6-phosphogluconolactonase [Calditrichaeota bacterium]|nr:6-phosphogluconolactonase [Calditrichota bacterium]
MNPEVIYCEFPEDVAEAAAALLKELQDEAIAERNVFRVALSGGSTPKLLFHLLSDPEWQEEMEYDKWEVFWSDERCVDPSHPESNFRLAHDHFLSKVQVGEVFRMCGEHHNGQESADAYARTLKGRFMPETVSFDAILLGMGEDGHTASLFPGSSALESGALVEAVEVKNNAIPQRLTLTLRVLNSAQAVIFLVTGSAKAERVHEVLMEDRYELPAARVNPMEGRLIWILDEDAASELTE